MTRQVLGYPLPLAQLTDWVRGRGAGAGSPELDAVDACCACRTKAGRSTTATPAMIPQAPPMTFAERVGGLELRLRIDEWISLPPGEVER